DVVESGAAWPELVAVKDCRLQALELCFEAELACGRHHELVGELESVFQMEPTRERLCAQLMLALYRDGRQVDALSVFRKFRSRLGDRVGIEPGRDLQGLERAILEQDPSLEVQQQRARLAGEGHTTNALGRIVAQPGVESPGPDVESSPSSARDRTPLAQGI